MKQYKVCQSCGIPLWKDELGAGTESSRSKSVKYCSHCYMDGKFVQDITPIQMQQFVQEHLIKNIKIPKFLAKFLVRDIPKLERWK